MTRKDGIYIPFRTVISGIELASRLTELTMTTLRSNSRLVVVRKRESVLGTSARIRELKPDVWATRKRLWFPG